MKIYLAGLCSVSFCKEVIQKSKYNLESFYYFQDWELDLLNNDFLLDSGAFTFMQNQKHKHKLNWDEYVRNYADFINKNKIEKFFELDIDSIVGIKEVERLRYLLESLTNKKCIPVWHKSRGKEYYLNLIKEYNYIAIGGIAAKEIKRNEYKYFPWFIEKAHQSDCKVHGLGFTYLSYLKTCKFDSVDSTTWTCCNRFGELCKFQNSTMKRISVKNHKLVKQKEACKFNLLEWIKFQNYARYNL